MPAQDMQRRHSDPTRPKSSKSGKSGHSRKSSKSRSRERRSFAAENVGDSTLEQPPIHPIPQMQGAFEESIADSIKDGPNPLKDPKDRLSPKERRRIILDPNRFDSNTWKSRPKANYHPLTKLIAQISFGMHLLTRRLAKSDEEVVRILQRHVDEVDSFMERTSQDFDLALTDIKERTQYLRLPLEHVNIFDVMLNDKPFRTSIIEGNMKIEFVVDRTADAMSDSLWDVGKGIEATAAMAEYMNKLSKTWCEDNEDLNTIYAAMLGNAEGWMKCFEALESKGSKLTAALTELQGTLTEMSKRAAVASKRNLGVNGLTDKDQTDQKRGRGSPPTSRFSHDPLPLKALPASPKPVIDTERAILTEDRKTNTEEDYGSAGELSESTTSPVTPLPPKELVQATDQPDAASRKIKHEVRSELHRTPSGDLADFFRTTKPPETVSQATNNPADPKAKQTKSGLNLKRIPSRLKKKSYDELGRKLKSPSPTRTDKQLHPDHASPHNSHDSAYASGSDHGNPRPATCPPVLDSDQRPKSSSFALFPPKTLSGASIKKSISKSSIVSRRKSRSTEQLGQDQVKVERSGSRSGSCPSPVVARDRPSRPASAGSSRGGFLRGSGSLGSLMKFFKRKESEPGPGSMRNSVTVSNSNSTASRSASGLSQLESVAEAY